VEWLKVKALSSSPSTAKKKMSKTKAQDSNCSTEPEDTERASFPPLLRLVIIRAVGVVSKCALDEGFNCHVNDRSHNH
jgi:hypothetical protein